MRCFSLIVAEIRLNRTDWAMCGAGSCRSSNGCRKASVARSQLWKGSIHQVHLGPCGPSHQVEEVHKAYISGGHVGLGN